MADDELVKIFETAQPGELAIVRSMLDAAEVPFTVEGDGALGVLPLGSFGRSFFGRAVSAVIRVPANVESEARALIEGAEVEEGQALDDTEG